MLSEMYDLLGLGRYRMQTLVLIRQLTEKFGNKNSEGLYIRCHKLY